MHDQGIPDGPESIEQAVLSMLVAHGGVWSDDEVAREMGDPTATTDALANLYGAGLVHRLSGFVFATRPAVRAAELA